MFKQLKNNLYYLLIYILVLVFSDHLRSTKFIKVKKTLLNTLKLCIIIGSFSNGDGNENFKKNNRFIKQNNKFERISHFFVHFFAVTARLRRENA